MKNLRNTKGQILQELQTSFKNKAMRNRSSHHLSSIETEVLTLGLNFIPTPVASKHHLVLKLSNHLTQTMKKQFHFRYQAPATNCPTYCKPLTWIPAEPNSTNLTLFLEQTLNPLPNPPSHIVGPNLTLQKTSTLKKLGSNSNLVIKPFNKGSRQCLIDTSLHISKIEKNLVDHSTYIELNFDPTHAIRNDVLSTLDYLYNTHQINDATRYHLTPPKPARIPLYYCCPKAHKLNIPFRPIV